MQIEPNIALQEAKAALQAIEVYCSNWQSLSVYQRDEAIAMCMTSIENLSAPGSYYQRQAELLHSKIYSAETKPRELLYSINGFHGILSALVKSVALKAAPRAATSEKKTILEVGGASLSNKRFGIFISSTYLDLKDHRQELMRMVLRKNCFPFGMELFGAQSRDPWQVITKEIDDCDYYLLVLAHRYGTISPGAEHSYTEREYLYAVEKNKPVLAFVLSSDVPWEDRFVDTGDNHARVKGFKERVTSVHQTYFWRDAGDLIANAAVSLDNEFAKNPQLGWIRGVIPSQQSTTSLAQETVAKTNLHAVGRGPLSDVEHVSLSLNTIYQRENLTPGIPQWGFTFEIQVENLGAIGLDEYVCEVSVIPGILNRGVHDGKQLSLKSDSSQSTFQFPEKSDSGKPIKLLNGRPETIGRIFCLIGKHNMAALDEIDASSVEVRFFGNGIKASIVSIPMSNLAPRRIMDIEPTTLVYGKNYTLPIVERVRSSESSKDDYPNLNNGEMAVFAFFQEKKRRHLVFESAILEIAPVFRSIANRGFIQINERTDGCVVSISDGAWALSSTAKFHAEYLEIKEKIDKQFLATLESRLKS